ncbi:MAG: 30S ribosome-binding factor RbfA [Gemmatimonadaceae bacterium]
MRNTRRADRVSEAIREVVASFLAEGGGAKDPRITGLVTVTGVDITSDLRHAKVFVSVLGTDTEKAATFDGLDSIAVHLRSQIAKTLQLRVAPQITFKVDESVAHAARIESLLEQIKKETPVREEPAAGGDAAETSDDEERQP